MTDILESVERKSEGGNHRWSILDAFDTVRSFIQTIIEENKTRYTVEYITLEDWQLEELKRTFEAYLQHIEKHGVSNEKIQQIKNALTITSTGLSFSFSNGKMLTIPYTDDSVVKDWSTYNKMENTLDVTDIENIISLLPEDRQSRLLFFQYILGMQQGRYWLKGKSRTQAKGGNAFYAYTETRDVPKKGQTIKKLPKFEPTGDPAHDEEALAERKAQMLSGIETEKRHFPIVKFAGIYTGSLCGVRFKK